MLRRECGDSFIAEAQVGIVMQPRGAITELGEFRQMDHAPGVFTCPPHVDSVDHTEALELLRVALPCWSE